MAQNQTNLDSLWNVWNDESQADTNRLKAIHKYAWSGYLYSQPDSAFYFAQLEYDFAKEKGQKRQMADAFITQGASYYVRSDYTKALEHYFKALKINEEIGDKHGIASNLSNIGLVFVQQGDYPKALKYYFKALKIDEEIGSKNGIASDLGNIGMVYDEQGDYPKALEYYFKALKINEETGNKNFITANLGNIGVVYKEQGDCSKALEYYFKALKIFEELGNKRGTATELGNIGNVYSMKGDYSKALEYHFKALKTDEELGNKNGIARHLGNIGSLYTATGNFKDAEAYLQKAIALDDSLGALNELMQLEEHLSQLYDTTGRYKLALIHYKKAIVAKDSVFSEEKSKEIGTLEAKAEYDKQLVLRQAEMNKQQALAVAESKRQKVVIWAVSGGLGLVVLFAFFIVNRLRITRKQKSMIEEQKEVVDEQNKEITDSITYAKRIQEAILPPENYMQELFSPNGGDAGGRGGCFILYKPKDIVAGDFYWMEEAPLNPPKGGKQKTPSNSSKGGESPFPLGRVGDGLLFAAADCTGHGVPGAMVSVVCHNAMNRAVREFGLRSPAEILDKTNELVEETFEKSENEVKDGMDISLCKLEIPKDKRQNPKIRLEWAGANSPLYLVRHSVLKQVQDLSESAHWWETLKQARLPDGQVQGDSAVLFEIPPDKQPVGSYEHRKPFTNHTIELQKGDCLYIFSDGFADQFGGPKGKKFKYKPFRELLLANHSKPMQEQKQLLDECIENWRGELEQVDDICVIGVRV